MSVGYIKIIKYNSYGEAINWKSRPAYIDKWEDFKEIIEDGYAEDFIYLYHIKTSE